MLGTQNGTKRKLVMAACINSHRTTFQSHKGEYGLRVVGLGDRDEVCLELEGYPILFLLHEGLNPFPKSVIRRRFRVVKIAGNSPEPTTVEVISDGPGT